VTKSLTKSYAERLAKPRCWPLCLPEDHRDEPAPGAKGLDQNGVPSVRLVFGISPGGTKAGG
jgi:hypothetical protein